MQFRSKFFTSDLAKQCNGSELSGDLGLQPHNHRCGKVVTVQGWG